MPITIGQRQNAQGQILEPGITQVDFDNDSAYPSLIGMGSWIPNSGLTIITGINGIGKTQLLDYLESCLKSTNCRDVYISSSFTPSVSGIADFGLVKEEFLRRFKNVEYLFQPDVMYGGDQRDLDVRENFRKKILARVRISYLLKYKIIDKDIIKNHFYLRHRVENIIQHERMEFRPGITTSNQFISILDTVLQVYVRTGRQEEAIAGINLALNKFKHEAFIKFADTPNPQIGFQTKGNNPLEVRPEKFSSGEKMILTFLAIKYAQSGIPTINGAVQHGNNQVNVILLDEPDRHFHPKFIKELYTVVKDTLVNNLGIQVIMITHNPSTVALANDSELFVMEKKGDEPARIRQCTKLLALAKLSREIQTYTGMHVKVYTESFDDAKFYEGIYANLMRYSGIIRENKLQGIAVAHPFLNELSTLSRRYQMGFYSASLEKGESGGHSEVKNIVRRQSNHVLSEPGLATHPDHYRISSSPLTNLFRAYKVDAPFGIIDRDYGSNPVSNEIKLRILKLNRHSLESYMYDPIIIASLFKDVDELNERIDSSVFSMHMRGLYRELLPNHGLINVASLQTRLDELYKTIFDICIDYESNYLNRFKIKLQEKIKLKVKQKNSLKTDDEIIDLAGKIVNPLTDDFLVSSQTLYRTAVLNKKSFESIKLQSPNFNVD